MKLKFETTKKEKHVFSIIFAFILIISNGAVAYFSTEELDKFIPDYLNIVIGMWMWYSWGFSSYAIFKHYSKKYSDDHIIK
jgi:hypothetical protein